jgi:tetratricopeptide (TPR) repeat protein
MVYERRGDIEAALTHDRRALAIVERIHGPQHPALGQALNSLGNAWLAKGDPRAAAAVLERSLAIREASLGPAHPLVATTLNNLGLAYTRLGQFARAQVALERARAVWLAQPLGPDHPSLPYTEVALAELFFRTGKLDLALEHAQRSLAFRERVLGAEHPQVAEPLIWMGRIGVSAHGHPDPFAPLHRALAILEHHVSPPSQLAQARFALALALWAEGRERPRAHALAVAAREHAGEQEAEVDAWLAAHP